MANRMETMSVNQYISQSTSFVLKTELHQPLCLLTGRTHQMFQNQQHYRNYLTARFVKCCQYRYVWQIEVVSHIYIHNLYPVRIIFSEHRKLSVWALCKVWFYRSGEAKLNDPNNF